MDQRELVERARGGDHDAFAALAGAFVARLDSAARLILRDHELARDAVQEGFLAAWRGLPTLRDPDRFEAWLHRLVFRSCIDVIRRRSRRPIEVELLPLDGPAIGDIASLIADRDLLDAALKRLQPEQRAVVVMHYYLGMPLPDVASALGIPIGTAKSRHHRSLAGHAPDDRRRPRTPAPASGWRAVRMTAFDRIEPRLPELMAELAPASVPDYFDDMLRQTGRTRQRPAWASLERWLPMDVVARPTVLRAPALRPLLILLLIGLLVAGGARVVRRLAADEAAGAPSARPAMALSSSSTRMATSPQLIPRPVR